MGKAKFSGRQMETEVIWVWGKSPVVKRGWERLEPKGTGKFFKWMQSIQNALFTCLGLYLYSRRYKGMGGGMEADTVGSLYQQKKVQNANFWDELRQWEIWVTIKGGCCSFLCFLKLYSEPRKGQICWEKLVWYEKPIKLSCLCSFHIFHWKENSSY